MALFRAASLTAFLILLGLGTTAHAQTPSPLASWQYSAGVVLAPLGGPAPDWQVTLGGGSDVYPLSDGSAKYRLRADPLIDVRYKDLAFFSVGEGLGVNLLRGTTYRAGVAVSYDVGRRADDEGRLHGLGNISPAPAIKLFAEYSILPVVITANIRRVMGGADGFIGDIGAYMPLVGKESIQVFAGPSITFADGTYMRHYFGISAQQALNTRFARHNADAGFKNVNFGVTAIYHVSPKWFIEGDAAVQHLLGDAASSPIVARATQFTAGFNVGYQF